MQSVLLQKSYSLNEFERQNAIGLTTVRGRLVARKVGRRTIIAAEATAPGIVSETAAAPQAGGACARTRCAE